MDYCNYHPLSPATFHCETCHSFHCDNCADEGERGGDPLCFNCSQVLLQLGSANTATPFWRRLQESFRYPLNANAMVLLVGVTLLTAVAAYLPLALLWILMLSGAFLKYCFSCLENTARGSLTAPDITEAYDGGLVLLVKLLFVVAAATAAIIATAFYVGLQLAGLLAVFIVAAFPALIIIYGMTESLLEAVNPLNQLRLVASVGLPYGLLLAFIAIMIASVEIITQLIGNEYSFLASSLQSLTANYYTLVVFHIMGYMIFQYQGELGFTAREDSGERKPPRSARDRLAAKIDISLKDGDYNRVVALFQEALKKFPGDREFNRQYFEFLYATRRDLEAAGSRYLDYLIRSDQLHQLVIIYKRILHLLPGFRPATAATRHQLAKACRESGDPLSCAKLINGMHKEFGNYPQLPEAFELMASALDDLPGREQQARQCRAMAEQLRRRRTHDSSADPKPRTAQRIQKIAADAKAAAPAAEPDVPASDKSAAMPPIDFQ